MKQQNSKTGYVFEFHGKQFDPDGQVAMPDWKAHNKALSDNELAEWAKIPSVWSGYVCDSHNDFTTWNGGMLGRVVSRSFYTSNLGVRTESIRIKGTNGAEYYGRKGLRSTDLLRVRKVRS